MKSASPLSVLVVENHQDTLQAIKEVLLLEGYTVRCAANCKEAMDALQENSIDLLLSDIGLPDCNGWELIERARKKHPVVAIAMTGFGSVVDLARSRAAGFNAHLTKPFTPEQLAAAFAKVLEAPGEGELPLPLTAQCK